MKKYYVIKTKKQAVYQSGLLCGRSVLMMERKGFDVLRKMPHASLEDVLGEEGQTVGGCCCLGSSIANSRMVMVITQAARNRELTPIKLRGSSLSAKVDNPDLIVVVEQYHCDQPQSSASKWSCLSSIFKSQSPDFDSSQPYAVVAFSNLKPNEKVAVWNKRLKAMKQYCAQLNSTSRSSAVNAKTRLLS